MIEVDKKKTKGYRYNDWLEYFSSIPAGELRGSQEELEATLPSEGYAALARWLEIFDNPSKMDKLSQGRIKAQNEANIMEVAVGDDDEAFYKDLIRKNVAELEGASPQEVARLSQNINIYRRELQEIRSHRPKSGSTLERVLAAASKSKNQAKTASKKSSTAQKATKTTKKTKKSSAKRSLQKKEPSKTRSKGKKRAKTIDKSSGENDG